ncbi:alpha/beta-hydrolase [Dothidotthia symphoricarpi CBS 119687]|uniref:Alpha/beta-hydrolase n=1 Tax=Dothidotthia symphoricarpi CBS 119687 TaxID=1392245 RepID=A0A6A6A413_9PLEO|nr:alpha/beta-hydrolase [Dothidotthia symphoricarpi CBS 119687]KAF2125331.1 alpha/beta-hydrolase [Dothidotthia symphoricarpi CBS 119687]
MQTYLTQLFTPTRQPTAPPLPALDPPPKCRFRLDNDTSHTLTLPDGRALGYAQYGSPTGKAIFYQHGLPGSRLEAATYHDLGLELGARIIATDRPGMGWSTPYAGRTLLDHAKDVEYLATHLGLREYAVLGVSGGGPYALALAVALPPTQLKAVALVCGIGPPDIGMRGAGWVHWLGFTIGWRYSPSFLLRWFFQRDPMGRVDLSDEQRLALMLRPSNVSAITHDKDRVLMSDEHVVRLMLRTTREAYTQGFEGVREDGRLICVDWGFCVEDVRPDLDVQLWYGREDTFVPLNHGEQIAKRLGGRARLRVEDDTHASISMNWKREQLEGLIRAI